MKIVSIYKTFKGEEFVLASLRSIYSAVDLIIFVHQDTGWTGRKGNTVRAVVKALPDPDKKIIHLECNGTQNQQYDAALKWIFDNDVLFDYLQLIDTDEVWEDVGWGRIKSRLRENLGSMIVNMSVCCRLYDYMKSPFYRVEPPGPLHPVCFVHKNAVKFGAIDIRGAGIYPRLNCGDVFFHHFCSVRKNLTEVWAKHAASAQVENEPMPARADWVKNIWNKLPYARNVLPLTKHAAGWQGIRVVGLEDLPAAVRDNPIVQAWHKYPQKAVGCGVSDARAFAAALKAVGLPPDFGPSHIDWKMPSKRNKLALALQKVESGEVGKAPEPAAAVLPAVAPKQAEEHISPAKRNKELLSKNYPGSLAIYTIVSGAYQWYAPLFLDRIKMELPFASPMVYLRGTIEIPEKWARECIVFDDDKNFASDGAMTAALRFLSCPEDLKKFDYVLITDIDMLFASECPNLIQQHCMTCDRDNLGCYDNYVSMKTGDGKPMKFPGVHFVKKEWWARTAEARERAHLELRAARAEWDTDERVLARIVVESGLPYTATPRLWTNHGIHLGDWRRRIIMKHPYAPPDAIMQNQILRMLRDEEFLGTVRECAPHLDKLAETFDIFKKSVGV